MTMRLIGRMSTVSEQGGELVEDEAEVVVAELGGDAEQRAHRGAEDAGDQADQHGDAEDAARRAAHQAPAPAQRRHRAEAFEDDDRGGEEPAGVEDDDGEQAPRG